MKNLRKRMAALVAVIAMLVLLAVPAAADIDPDEPVHLGIKLQTTRAEDATPYPNTKIYLYRVGDIVDLADGSVELYDAYKSTDIGDINDMSAKDMMKAAYKLAKYVDMNNVEPTYTGTTNEDGEVYFLNIEMGMYVLAFDKQNEVDKYVNAALLQLPFFLETDSGDWHYYIKVYPKSIGSPDNPIEIPDEDPPLGDLPPTGMVQWPVPVLAFAGVAFLGGGVVLVSKKKKDEQ